MLRSYYSMPCNRYHYKKCPFYDGNDRSFMLVIKGTDGIPQFRAAHSVERSYVKSKIVASLDEQRYGTQDNEMFLRTASNIVLNETSREIKFTKKHWTMKAEIDGVVLSYMGKQMFKWEGATDMEMQYPFAYYKNMFRFTNWWFTPGTENKNSIDPDNLYFLNYAVNYNGNNITKSYRMSSIDLLDFQRPDMHYLLGTIGFFTYDLGGKLEYVYGGANNVYHQQSPICYAASLSGKTRRFYNAPLLL